MEHANRWDICQPIENKNTGKTYFNRLGTMFETKNGFSITLNSLPIQQYSEEYGLQLRMLAMPPLRDKPQETKPASDGFGDDIPW